MTLPLQDIRVLDFTHLLPGELCSTILADMGADITRVESLKPGLGQKLPPIVKGESLYYWALHRHKRRVALDLKNERGTEIIHKMVEKADVVVENFRPGVMKRLGIGYEKMRQINPRVLYCSISSYGQNSEFSQRPGHDLNLQAETGVLSMSTEADGKLPLPGVLLSDYMTATYAALSVVSALHQREKTGKGQHLDLSMFHCTLSALNIISTAQLYTKEQPREVDPLYRNELPNYNLYKCKDGRYLAVASLEPQFWEEFCKRLGRPEWIAKHPNGPDHDLKEEISKTVCAKTLAEWKTVFDDSNCCVSPVHTLEEGLDFLPTREKGMVKYLEHPTLGQIPQVMTPVPFQLRPEDLKAPAPASQSTPELLKQLGYDADKIEKLAADGVIPQLVHAGL